MDNKPKTLAEPAVFCGVDTLVKKLSDVAVTTTNIEINNHLNDAVSELYLLDGALGRLKSERKYVDESDIDAAIDQLRG